MSYSVRLDVETVYGKDNILKWADLNNEGNLQEINDRIDWAIALADEHIDNRLRTGPYVIPFVDPEPLVITDTSARLAGWYLYQSRGFVDQEDTRENQLKTHYDHAEGSLNDILSERITLDAERRTDKTYPTVTEESTGYRRPYGPCGV